MSALRPLQSICAQPTCRVRQTVPADRIWFVDVRANGGSHREAGWSCRACGQDNLTKPSHLPKGMLGQLPSRARVEERLAAARPAPPGPASAPEPAAPVWRVGAEGRALLVEGLRRLAEEGGDALALALEHGVLQPLGIEAVLPTDGSPADASAVLGFLDASDADILVLAGTRTDGSAWRIVLHAGTGAASFADAG